MDSKIEKVTKQLTQNTIMLSVCALVNRGLMFIMIPFFSRWLTVAEYGTYDVYATYVALLIPIITLASSNAVFRLAIDCESEGKKLYYISNGLCISLVNLVVAVFVIEILAIRIGWIYSVPFLVLLGAEILDNYFQGYLRAIKKLKIYAMCKTATVVFTAIMVTILVRYLHMGLPGILYGYACGFGLSSLLIIILTKYWRVFKFKAISIKGVKEILEYSFPLIPNDISWWVINASDRIIINFVIGDIANGIYAIACKIPNLCSSIFGVFNTSWQEASVDMINSKEDRTFFYGIYNRMLSLLISLSICIVSCNFIFFDYLFDSQYSTARLYTPILITSIIFSMISQFYGGIQISLKQPKANGITTIGGAIVNLFLHIILINYVGLYAAAISTLVSNMCVALWRRKKLKYKYTFRVNRINRFCIGAYVYFVCISYMAIDNLIFNIMNLLVATVLAIIFNKKIFIKFILRVVR